MCRAMAVTKASSKRSVPWVKHIKVCTAFSVCPACVYEADRGLKLRGKTVRSGFGLDEVEDAKWDDFRFQEPEMNSMLR